MTWKNLGNVAFVALILAMVFVPRAKAILLRGIMEVGLLKPNTHQVKSTAVADLSALKFKDASGKVLSLGDLKGKVIFVNFWATWCPPCLAEMPSIHKFYQQYKNDGQVAFVMVDADGDFIKTNAYLKRKGYDFPAYTFYSELPSNIFGGSLPTTVVFDKQGRLALHEVGAANYSSKKFLDFIEKLNSLKN